MDQKKKILLIDDDEAIINYLAAKLSKNYELVTTTQPRKAVALARAESPDVILCDIDMPDFGGGDVAAALAEDPQTAGIPLIYLTSLVSPQEARDMDGFVGGRPGVAKKATLAELLSRIEEQTSRH